MKKTSHFKIAEIQSMMSCIKIDRKYYMILISIFFWLYSCGYALTADSSQECLPASLSLGQYFQWPAGGHELIVMAEDENGLPWKGSAECLFLSHDGSEAQLQAQIVQQALTPGLTMIVVHPTTGDRSQYTQAIQRFIEKRPQKERIAIYGWGQTLTQITDFTKNHKRLQFQLNRLNRINDNGGSQSAQVIFDQALEIIQDVESTDMRGTRNLVFINDSLPSDMVPQSSHGVTVQWILPQSMLADLPEGHTVGIENLAEIDDALNRVSERLDQNAAQGYYKIGVCSDPDNKSAAWLTDAQGTGIDVTLKKSIDGERNGNCDPSQIISAKRPDIDTIHLFIDEEEMAVYGERLQEVAELEAKNWWQLSQDGFGNTKDKFDIHISLGPSQTPVKATAHFRGNNALFCDRKSYTINIDGKDSRFLGEESASDEFYLNAMCEDVGLFKAFLGDSLYDQFDLFPLKFRYVEVLLNNETQGIYLMIEKRDDEIRKDSGRLRGIVRLRYESDVEVKYSRDGAEEELIDAFTEMLGKGVYGNELPIYLREHMDLDQQLYWIGLNSLMENADTIDECFYISKESIDSDGNPTDYFQLMGWDPEDIQGRCRSIGYSRAHHGLTFCRQNPFGQRILRNREIFKDYAAILKNMLTEVTPQRFQAILDQSREQLFPLLERPGVAAAMLLPDINDATSAKSMVLDLMTESQQKFEDRHARLRKNIQAWEADQ